MFLKPDIKGGETYTGAVRECIESTWRNNPILLFEAIRDATARADFANALVLASELDAQKGLPYVEPTLTISNKQDGSPPQPERCPACDRRFHPPDIVHNIYEERELLARGTGRRTEEKASTTEARRTQRKTGEEKG